MGKFSEWLYNLMQGRYGFDQFGRAISVLVIIVWIIGIILGVFSNLFGLWAAIAARVFNWIGLILMIYMLFRVFSKNHEKRRAENERYLRWSSRGKQSKDIYSKRESKSAPIGEQGYKYLTCSFCGQQMRVPKGKGKIAVKCPSCGEKTIINS